MFKYRNTISITAFTLGLAAGAPLSWADDEGSIPFDEAELFFELNNTDGDLGIHALIDGEAWKNLEIEDVRERAALNIYVRGRLRRQGLTQLFFESAEPTFDELAPATFFRRFPAGVYEISARTLEGQEMESEMELTHVIPASPGGITLNTTMDPLTEGQCVGEDPAYAPPQVTLNEDGTVTISWQAVEESHPDIEDGPGVGLGEVVEVEIENYELVAEVLNDFGSTMHVILPPEMTSYTLSPDFIAQGVNFKYEILAREASFNQTAVESCFDI